MAIKKTSKGLFKSDLTGYSYSTLTLAENAERQACNAYGFDPKDPLNGLSAEQVRKAYEALAARQENDSTAAQEFLNENPGIVQGEAEAGAINAWLKLHGFHPPFTRENFELAARSLNAMGLQVGTVKATQVEYSETDLQNMSLAELRNLCDNGDPKKSEWR
jgi:hypothetical protein